MPNEENVALVAAAVRNLWGRFCGITDEFRTLKERWEYLRPRTSGSLPDITHPTFSSLEEAVSRLEKEFLRYFGLERQKGEDTIKIVTSESLDALEIIRGELFHFTTYVNLLKQSFYQRTVSLEIPHVASGIPHSPERSIGNEAVYVAADTIAGCYTKQLRFLSSNWDGIVSYVIAPTEEEFYGAFMKPTEALNLFHVSMSDEMKYFLPSYLMLAHELAHECVRSFLPYEDLLREDQKFPLKDYRVTDGIYAFYIARMRAMDTLGVGDYSPLKGENECPHCIFSRKHLFPGEASRRVYRRFDDTLCDIVACRIAGICSLLYFLDNSLRDPFTFFSDGNRLRSTPRGSSIVRISGTGKYLHDEGLLPEKLEKLLSMGFFADEIERERNLLDPQNEQSDVFDAALVCLDCYQKIGENFSTAIRDYEAYHKREIGESVFSLLIEDLFEISAEEEKALTDSLESGRPVSGYSPSKIMHTFYRMFREGRNPSYPAALFSLANSTQ